VLLTTSGGNTSPLSGYGPQVQLSVFEGEIPAAVVHWLRRAAQWVLRQISAANERVLQITTRL